MNRSLLLAHKKSDDDNLIPLINIVFLLLIFFIVAGQMRSQLPASLTLPQSSLGATAQPQKINLHINRDLQMQLNGAEVAAAELPELLAQKNITSQSEISVFADNAITALALSEILLLLESQGVETLNLVLESHASD